MALPRLRLRRLAVLVPFAGLVGVMLATVTPAIPLVASGGAGDLSLDRTGQGLLMAAAVSVALLLLVSAPVRGPELLCLGVAGAAAVVAATATDPVVWAVSLFSAMAVLALRWIAAAPGRISLAAGRAGMSGAAVLLAAAPFLPITGVISGGRPLVAAALLATGLAALLGLLPMGGWAHGAMSALRSTETAPWPLVLAPAALLTAQRLPLTMPPLAASTFGRVLLWMGLATAVWCALRATRAGPGSRYPRVFVADLALAAASLGAGHLTLAQTGGLFLLLTHLLLAPLLLQEGQRTPHGARRVAWLLLSGLPPSPAFWGRLVLVEALSQVSAVALTLTLAAMGAQFVGAVLALRGETAGPPRLRGIEGAAALLTCWLIVAAGVVLGLLPQAGATFVFGSI